MNENERKYEKYEKILKVFNLFERQSCCLSYVFGGQEPHSLQIEGCIVVRLFLALGTTLGAALGAAFFTAFF